MTYDQLIREVAGRHTSLNKSEIDTLRAREHISLAKVEKIVKEVFTQIHKHVLEQGGTVAVPAFGRFLSKTKRSRGTKPDGTRWERPGRRQLALNASPSASVKKPKTGTQLAPPPTVPFGDVY